MRGFLYNVTYKEENMYCLYGISVRIQFHSYTPGNRVPGDNCSLKIYSAMTKKKRVDLHRFILLFFYSVLCKV